MIFLTFLGVDVAQPEIQLQIVRRLKGEQRLRHIRFQRQKVAGFIVVPAPVSQEIALVVGRHTAQAIAAKINIVTRRLQRQRPEIELCCQPGVKDQRFIVGIPAEIVTILIEDGDSARQFPGKLTSGFHRTTKAIARTGNGARFNRGVERGLFGNIVEQPAGCRLPIEHPRRTLEKLQPFDIEGLRHRKAGIGIAAQTVEKILFLPESARCHAGIAEHRDARDIAVEILRIACTLIPDQVVGDDRDRLAGRERIGRQLPRCRLLDPIKPFSPADNDNIVILIAGLPVVLSCEWRCCTEEHQ